MFALHYLTRESQKPLAARNDEKATARNDEKATACNDGRTVLTIAESLPSLVIARAQPEAIQPHYPICTYLRPLASSLLVACCLFWIASPAARNDEKAAARNDGRTALTMTESLPSLVIARAQPEAIQPHYPICTYLRPLASSLLVACCLFWIASPAARNDEKAATRNDEKAAARNDEKATVRNDGRTALIMTESLPS